MVRTDTRARADELETVYTENTSLRLETIHSRYSARTVRASITRLRDGDLDGVIAVDMLGEGFDFPNLKVAAVHAPHRSLGSTIQFIGRFARTTGASLGRATFLAIPSEIDTETRRLYQEEAIWEQVVPNLIDDKVSHEVRVQEELGTYELTSASQEEDKDISLWSLTPYFHAKIYQTDGNVDLDAPLELGPGLEIIHRRRSDNLRSIVIVAREQWQPKWTSVSQFASVEYELVVCYHDHASNLLFICSSRREEGLYESVASTLTGSSYRRLPLSRINRALRDLTNPEFFSIGMRNRQVTSSIESYRTLTGPSVHRAIRSSDGRLFHQGHSFGRALNAEREPVTIGLASSSKIWSNRYAQLPDLIDWCRDLGAKLSSPGKVATGSEFDFLGTDEEVTSLPGRAIAGSWDWSPAVGIPTVTGPDGNGHATTLLWDVALDVDVSASTEEAVVFDIATPQWQGRVRLALDSGPQFTWETEPERMVTVDQGREALPMLDYLHAHPPTFFFPDCSSLVGNLLVRRPSEGNVPVDVGKIEAVDWAAAGVNIMAEELTDGKAHASVHDYLRDWLRQGQDDVVAYDHGAGEIADFVAIRSMEGAVVITFYHCKKSGGVEASARVNDAYEVCGQAVKSVAWANPDTLRTRLARRVKPKAEKRMVKGTWQELEDGLNRAKGSRMRIRVVVVQPGISSVSVNEQIASVLAAADDYVTSSGDFEFRVMGSA